MNEVKALIEAIEALIPEYMNNPEDSNICNGNAAVCIIDEDDNIYGKLFGTDTKTKRAVYQVAWKKASQAWVTGYKTGEFEVLVYTNKVNLQDYGIMNPDLIGWVGGQPIKLNSGRTLSVGFSGFRGPSDVEIVLRAKDTLT